jgi:hypothetical protein
VAASGSSGGSGHSQHPADRLLRDLIQTGRSATPPEIAESFSRMATAPFITRQVPVPAQYRGLTYQGRALGAREPSLFLHLVERVVVDEQWVPGTTAGEYLADLRSAIEHADARLLVYQRRGDNVAAVFAPNVVPPGRLGRQPQPWLYVVYSADYGTITSGYQASGLQAISMPSNARWLK